MKNLTPKSENKEKTKEVLKKHNENNSLGGIHSAILASNLLTFLMVMLIAYIVTTSGIHQYKNNMMAASSGVDQLKWSEVSNSLSEIKQQLDELQKHEAEASKDPSLQKALKDHHVQQLISIIKTKIISGDGFASEISELSQLGFDEKDASFQIIKNYQTSDRLKVNELLSNLYDEAASRTKHADGEGFINSIKHFFTNLLTVKKLDENKIHATSNEISSIIVQLLLDGRIQAAYTVASKFHGVDASITKIADALRPASEALDAVDKLNGAVNG